jgi:hypothetical protein
MTDEIDERSAKLYAATQKLFLENQAKRIATLEPYVGKYLKDKSVTRDEFVKVLGLQGDSLECLTVVSKCSVFGSFTGVDNIDYYELITEEEFNKALNVTLAYLNPNQPQEVEVWASMSGDYCAFHEASISVVYDLTNKLIVDDHSGIFAESVGEGLAYLKEFNGQISEYNDYEKLKALKVGNDYYLKL